MGHISETVQRSTRAHSGLRCLRLLAAQSSCFNAQPISGTKAGKKSHSRTLPKQRQYIDSSGWSSEEQVSVLSRPIAMCDSQSRLGDSGVSRQNQNLRSSGLPSTSLWCARERFLRNSTPVSERSSPSHASFILFFMCVHPSNPKLNDICQPS